MFNLGGYSYYAGRLFGIPLRLHWSLLAFMVAQIGIDLIRIPPSYYLAAFLVTVLCTASILWHELAHALMARHFRYSTQDITLLAFGGLARIGGNPSPAHELRISAAGPFSNFFLWWACLTLVDQAPYYQTVTWVLKEVARFNMFIGLFNLLPAFPLDGGSILLSALRMRMPWERANYYGYSVGVWISAPLGLICLLTNQLLGVLVFYTSYMLCSQLRGHAPPPAAHRPARRTSLEIDWSRYQVKKPSFWQRIKDTLTRKRQQRDTPRKFRVIHSDREDHQGPVN